MTRPSLHRPTPATALLAAVLAALSAAASCGGSTTSPTPPPPDPGAPVLTCPAAISMMSPDGNPVAVSYAAPTVTGGAPPLTGPTCTPASNALFPVGNNTVTCTVTDARQRSNTCTVTVTVTPPPKLIVTRFLAFGDSITWGEDGTSATTTSRSGRVLSLRPAVQFPADQTYPGVLQSDLSGRYVTQRPNVANAGLRDEAVTDSTTFPRYVGYTSSGNYDVVLLMEGANDLASQNATTISNAVAGLQQMVEDAKSRNLKVFLATIPPENPNGCCPDRGQAATLVPGFNDRVRTLAASEQVPLVDVYAAFNGDVTTLIGFDGLHPTAGGYAVIASTFFAAIRANLETSAVVTPHGTPLRTPAPRVVR